MELFVRPAVGNEFRVNGSSFPIIISITSEKDVEIAGEPLVNCALLTKSDDPELSFGFSVSITRLPGKIRQINPDNPYHIDVNVLQFDDDLMGLVSGEYQLKVDVTVFLKEEDQGMRPLELTKVISLLLEKDFVADFK